ncbi:MAG: pantetheine-phosphate adenylyltransferase [bacterium]
MVKKAIYPGSFDPFTLGHFDIALRALKMFDEIYIAIGENKDKATLFSVKERISHITEIFKDNPNIAATSFDGLLVDFAKKIDVYTVIRGLRSASEFEFETQMAFANHAMEPQLETIFFAASKKHSFLSSSIVKEIASKSKKDLSKFVAPEIERALYEKFK